MFKTTALLSNVAGFVCCNSMFEEITAFYFGEITSNMSNFHNGVKFFCTNHIFPIKANIISKRNVVSHPKIKKFVLGY